MLRMDDQRARSREIKLARDRAVSFGRERSTVRGQSTGRGLRLGGTVVMPAGVRQAGTASSGSAQAILGEDDGAEPGATDALSGPLPGDGTGGDENQSPPSFSHSLYQGRYRIAGAG